MTEENKSSTIETVAATEAPQEIPRGPSGQVGEPTAALTIKQRWHAESFHSVDAGDKYNPRKRAWVRNKGAVSLKRFARQLLATGDQVAKDWFAGKAGADASKRTDANIKAAREAAVATRLERRKKAEKNQQKKT